jgi:hypothetical protein
MHAQGLETARFRAKGHNWIRLTDTRGPMQTREWAHGDTWTNADA